MTASPRFNILEHSNCQGDNSDAIVPEDFVQRCVEQVTTRLYDNGASFQRIIDHVLDICHYFFQRHTLAKMAPQLLDYRLFMLLTNTIWTELFYLLSPHQINIDFALLFNLRNFGVYASMLAPCGRIAEGYQEMERCHFGRSLVHDK
jgi:hypothetical protein